MPSIALDPAPADGRDHRALDRLVALGQSMEAGREGISGSVADTRAADGIADGVADGVADGAGASGMRPSLRRSVSADFRGASWGRRLALVGVVAWIVYEWGPGNETVTPWLVLTVLDRANDGPGVIAVAAIVGFVFTLVQQLLSGVTALVGFSLFDRTAAAAWRQLSVDGTKQLRGWHETSIAARFAMAFSLGTTAVALVQISTSGVVGVRRHLRAIVESALAVASTVGLLGALAGVLAWVGRSVPALAGATDTIIRVVGNPLLWLGLVVVIVLIDRRNGRKAASAGAS